MFRSSQKLLKSKSIYIRQYYSEKNSFNLPNSSDAIIIGGGSAGCHIFYHLAKRGIKSVLIERNKLTSGTTWHTAGLIWSFRMSDIDIKLLKSSRELLMNLENETGLNPGWIQNGTLFIAHTKNRMDEYNRLSSLGTALGIQNEILNNSQTVKYFPLLNEKDILGSLYSPGDGVIDPTMLCKALTQGGIDIIGSKIIENCSVEDLMVDENRYGKKVVGVRTPKGNIKSNTIINATGAWGADLLKKYDINLPLVPMRHAYVVSEAINGVRGLPNIRDHDLSIYFRIQGESICMGGYENNPIIEKKLPKDFQFSLYDLDWLTFDQFIKGAINLCPEFGNYGIKSTICGPESFTPDHRPIMGPDPNIFGLYHNFGFNSSGMMFGGGCAEQIVSWIIDGQPTIPMHQYDVKRFTPKQCANKKWIRERSHESYVKNYDQIFPHAQKLSGRNIFQDVLHNYMIDNGAFMEEKYGWERPGFFINDKKINVINYDWYGCYGNEKNINNIYVNILKGDLKYDFSEHFELIKNEALSCRNNAAVFNLSSTAKFYVDGPDSDEAIKWIFSNDVGNAYDGNSSSGSYSLKSITKFVQSTNRQTRKRTKIKTF